MASRFATSGYSMTRFLRNLRFGGSNKGESMFQRDPSHWPVDHADKLGVWDVVNSQQEDHGGEKNLNRMYWNRIRLSSSKVLHSHYVSKIIKRHKVVLHKIH